jgi:hypothetical protein
MDVIRYKSASLEFSRLRWVSKSQSHLAVKWARAINSFACTIRRSLPFTTPAVSTSIKALSLSFARFDKGRPGDRHFNGAAKHESNFQEKGIEKMGERGECVRGSQPQAERSPWASIVYWKS